MACLRGIIADSLVRYGRVCELEGNELTEADQRAKLKLVADLAHRL